MKSLSTRLLVLGLLAAPFAAFGDVQITSFEDGLAPWIEGVGTNGIGQELTYQITTEAATHGTSSAEVIVPMGEGLGGFWAPVLTVTTDNYATVVVQATGIQADVYFEWPDRPASTDGGAWYSIGLEINSTNTGTSRIDTPSGTPNITEGQWRTLFFPLSTEQATQLAASGQTTSQFGFHLGAGTWGGAPMGGNIKLRFDNVVVVGASAGGPAAPTDLAGTAVLGGADLSWTASPDALTYTVKRRASPTDAYVTVASDLTTTSYSDTGLEGGTTYYYVVTASNADGESGFSTSVAVTTPNDDVLLSSFESGLPPWNQGPATAAGDAPITYAINTTSASEGTSSAEASIPMLGGQYLQFYTAAVGSYRTDIAQSTGIKADVYVDWIDRPAGSGTGGTWFNLALNYSYDGTGNFGDISATSGAPVIGEWQTLTWNLTPEQIAAFTANERSFSNLGFTLNAGTWGDGVTGGTIVVRIDNIRVKGFREVAVPAAPTGLVATAGEGQVGLTWDASATALGYTVQRSTTSGGPYDIAARLGDVTSYTDTGLNGETTYYYVVVPVNAGGDGAASAEASATTEAITAGIAVWRQTHFGSSEATGDAANDADPDADGVPNLLEYALAGDPMVAEQDLLPVATVVDGKLTLAFDRISDGTLLYEVLASSDLVAWSAIWSSTGDENTLGLVTVTDTDLISAHDRRFLRLRVTTP